MLRSLLFLGLVAAGAAVGLGACGARGDLNQISSGAVSAGPTSSSTSATTGGGGASGAAGAGSAGEGSGGAGGGEAMCAPPPPPSSSPPDGCSENMGGGWVQVPCVCELWLQNTTPGSATASIELTVTPPDQVPTFTGPLQIQVSIEDPDGSWYAIWAAQPGNGSTYTVTILNGETTVALGASDVMLAPVPLDPCEMRKVYGLISPDGSDSMVMMNMAAAIDAGSVVIPTSGPCFNPPHP